LEENAVFPIVIQPYSHVEQTAGKPRHPKTCNTTYFDAVRMTILYLFPTPFLPFSPSKKHSQIDVTHIINQWKRKPHITLVISPLLAFAFLFHHITEWRENTPLLIKGFVQRVDHTTLSRLLPVMGYS